MAYVLSGGLATTPRPPGCVGESLVQRGYGDNQVLMDAQKATRNYLIFMRFLGLLKHIKRQQVFVS